MENHHVVVYALFIAAVFLLNYAIKDELAELVTTDREEGDVWLTNLATVTHELQIRNNAGGDTHTNTNIKLAQKRINDSATETNNAAIAAESANNTKQKAAAETRVSKAKIEAAAADAALDSAKAAETIAHIAQGYPWKTVQVKKNVGFGCWGSRQDGCWGWWKWVTLSVENSWWWIAAGFSITGFLAMARLLKFDAPKATAAEAAEAAADASFAATMLSALPGAAFATFGGAFISGAIGQGYMTSQIYDSIDINKYNALTGEEFEPKNHIVFAADNKWKGPVSFVIYLVCLALCGGFAGQADGKKGEIDGLLFCYILCTFFTTIIPLFSLQRSLRLDELKRAYATAATKAA